MSDEKSLSKNRSGSRNCTPSLLERRSIVVRTFFAREAYLKAIYLKGSDCYSRHPRRESLSRLKHGRRQRVQTHEIELSVGDAVRIGDRVLTLIDIDNGEAAFRIDIFSRDACDSEVVEGFPLAE
jgi:hypothetical protein